MHLNKEITLSDLLPKRLPRKRRTKESAKVASRRTAGTNGFVGLEIGALHLTAAHIVDNGDRRVARLARVPLAPGIVDGGAVHDPVALGNALSELFTQASLPRRGVWLGIANNRIGVRTIEIAGIDDDQQLENAIVFRAHETLSVPLDESVIDYHVVSTRTGDNGELIREILVVVAYRDSVTGYLAATDAANIELAGIDFEAFALLRAVSEPISESEPSSSADPASAVVVVDVGHQRTVIAISDGRVCQFARVLEWGECEIERAIANTLNLPPSADQQSRGLSLESGSLRMVGLSPERVTATHDAVRYELQGLARDILSSLRFYQSQPGSLAIDGIVVAGVATAIPGFDQALARELSIPVSIADPLAHIRLADGVELPGVPGSLALSIGLGIHDRPAKAVNLLPVYRRIGRRQSTLVPFVAQPLFTGAVAVAIVVVAGLALLAYTANESVAQKRAQLERLHTQVAGMPRPEPIVSASTSQDLATRLSAVSSVTRTRVAWDGLLDSFSRAVPEDVWLVSLAAKLPPEATPAAVVAPGTGDPSSPSAFTISGYTYSQPSVARLMTRLALVPWLDRVSLVTSTKSLIDNQALFQFTVSADLDAITGAGS